jgi:hypothetical protein
MIPSEPVCAMVSVPRAAGPNKVQCINRGIAKFLKKELFTDRLLTGLTVRVWSLPIDIFVLATFYVFIAPLLALFTLAEKMPYLSTEGLQKSTEWLQRRLKDIVFGRDQ